MSTSQQKNKEQGAENKKNKLRLQPLPSRQSTGSQPGEMSSAPQASLRSPDLGSRNCSLGIAPRSAALSLRVFFEGGWGRSNQPGCSLLFPAAQRRTARR